MSYEAAKPEDHEIAALVGAGLQGDMESLLEALRRDGPNAGTLEAQTQRFVDLLGLLQPAGGIDPASAATVLDTWLKSLQSSLPAQAALLAAVEDMEGKGDVIRFLVERGVDPYAQVKAPTKPADAFAAFFSDEDASVDQVRARSPVEALVALGADPFQSFFSDEIFIATASALLGSTPVLEASELPEMVSMQPILMEGREAQSIAAQWCVDLLCAVDMMDAAVLGKWLHGRLSAPAAHELRLREGDRALELLGARAAPAGGLVFDKPSMDISREVIEERLAMQLLANGAELRCGEQGWRDIASRATSIGAPVIIQAAKGIGTYSLTIGTEVRLVERILARGGIGLDELHDGQTVLMSACLAGNAELVGWLIAAGADIDVRSGPESEMPGLTALQILRAERNPSDGDDVLLLLNSASSKLAISEIMEKSRAQPGSR